MIVRSYRSHFVLAKNITHGHKFHYTLMCAFSYTVLLTFGYQKPPFHWEKLTPGQNVGVRSVSDHGMHVKSALFP